MNRTLRFAGLSLRWQPRTALLCAVLALLALALGVLLLGIGSLHLSPAQVLSLIHI